MVNTLNKEMSVTGNAMAELPANEMGRTPEFLSVPAR